MAQVLAPIASIDTEHEKTPVLDPPATVFPHPSREPSEATLHTGVDGPPEDVKRPTIAAQKFETERFVAKRQKQPGVLRKRQSTTDPHEARQVHWSTSSDSDTLNSSDDEARPSLQRSKTMPARNALSKSELNKVRGRLRPDHLKVGNEYFTSSSRIAKDGRLNISVNETAQTGYLAKALGATIENHLGHHHKEDVRAAEKSKSDFNRRKNDVVIPPMNIVVMVIGSRGDIQPFLKIGQSLQKYGHRVRIASHPTFRKFVEEEIGLEFFSIGGDPAELMAFMVKNPGLIPSMETLKAGEIGRRRESMYEMFQGFWRSCVNAVDDESDIEKLKAMQSKAPFVADAIIANPPSFAHYHCAEKLSIPLHLVFTFPYSPTQSFPHPLANIKSSNVDQSYTNFMSYPLVDLMTWQGLGDLVNRFRVQDLGLEPVSTLWAPGQLTRLRVPMTYLWSPSLVPKPKDWGLEIDIVGYVFLDLASSYQPPEDLASFLKASDDRPLLYIGFGSISGIDDPTAFARMIFDAVEIANVRAVISRGWGGMGDGMDKTDGIFLVDNVPHDWLFPQVDAVVHHGGAGTTAAGLRFGKPTMIVPFFGDQPFWANMVAKAGAGAHEALPLKKLDVHKFAEGIRQCLEPETKAKAQEIAQSMRDEGDGADNAVDSFHRALVLDGPQSIRCSILPGHVAVWQIKHASTHLSALAAAILIENGELRWTDLELLKKREWSDFHGPGEPLTGAGGALVTAFRETYHGLATMSETTKKDIKQFDRRRRRKKGNSAIDGLVLPGLIAMAARGAPFDEQKEAHDRLVHQLNLHGEAEPAKLVRTTSETSLNTSPFEPIVKDIGKGLGHSSKALVTLPLELWTSLALGFHNAPRLYGDKTVRPSPHGIDGFRTGIQVAGKEFGLGIYDGLTGIVRVPHHDVQADGMSALPKGVLRGLGGLVLKPIAGVLGLGAYSAKGLQNSLRRHIRDTEKTERWIRTARMTQGQREIEHMRETGRISSSQNKEGTLSDTREQALRLWKTKERDKVAEEQEREKKLSLMKTQTQLKHGL